MNELRLPALSASPLSLRRSGLRWLRRSGDTLAAREPLAVCYARLAAARDGAHPMALPEEQNDLQVVLAPSVAGTVELRAALSKGGYQDMVEAGDWDAGAAVAAMDGAGELLPLVLAGRRGFENGEGRGALLAGWHERVRGSWEGGASGPFGTVLALGTCEQTAVFRGDDMAFLSWFARAPGPAQIVAVSDERCVHSSAVLLQHLRRTPQEAQAITAAVQQWLAECMTAAGPQDFPAFAPEAAQGTLHGRWPPAQNLLFALNLMAEAVATSPILERTQVLTARGVVEAAPPAAIAITLGSEVAPHFRHRRTGWIIALHGFRFGPFIGQGVMDWLRRDFERVPRTVADVERDLGALAAEVKARTGARLLVQNLIASSAGDRVSNYSWLGDAFAQSVAVFGNEANVMLAGLTRADNICVIDSDALAAQFGVRHCPDRFHASGELLAAQRDEVHRVLRACAIPGF